MIFGVSFCNGNIHKSRATRKGIIADARHAVGDCYARKPGATIESILADTCNATICGNNTIFET